MGNYEKIYGDLADQPLVSVIVPVYNAERYIRKTITSVLDQSYSRIEIILVDDGSTDHSSQIIAKLANSRSKQSLKVFHITNSGVSHARNYGIAHSNGDYIMFLDSDDWIEPFAIERLVSLILSYKGDLVIGNYERFYENEKREPTCHYISEKPIGILESEKHLVSLFLSPDTSLRAVSVWGKLYKREIIREHGVQFPEEISYEEDCCFNVQYYRYAERTILCNDIIYHYRQRQSSLSKTFKRNDFHFLMNGYQKRKALVMEAGLAERIPDLDYIMSIVIKNTCIKISESDISRTEKIEAYSEMIHEPGMGELCEKLKFPRKSLTGQLIRAIQREDPRAVCRIMEIYKPYSAVKTILRS